MSVWRERARKLIARLTAGIPADASLAERRKALHGKGWEAHQGTYWGRKMWGREVRAYLARHGGASSATTKSPPFQWPSDIAFPFREGANG